jgi:hypothetical protein
MNDQIDIESEPPEPPPINQTETGDIEHLRLDTEEAATLVRQLENRQRDIQRQLVELDDQIKAAKEASERATEAYYRVKPKSLPQEWVHVDMMAAARKQCPGRDEAEIKRLVGLLGASQRGSLAGEGIAYQKPLPDIEGQNVREINDHRYNIPAPPREPRERVKYG